MKSKLPWLHKKVNAWLEKSQEEQKPNHLKIATWNHNDFYPATASKSVNLFKKVLQF